MASSSQDGVWRAKSGISNLPSPNTRILHPREPAVSGSLIADPPAPSFIVEAHDGATRQLEVRHDEPNAREQLASMVLDFRHDPSGRGPPSVVGFLAS
jgi:hypothetical protein